MAIEGTYSVRMTRAEDLEITVTDATEMEVWQAIDLGWVSAGIDRSEYAAMSEEGKARFLAEVAVSVGLDYIESIGERISLSDCVLEG